MRRRVLWLLLASLLAAWSVAAPLQWRADAAEKPDLAGQAGGAASTLRREAVFERALERGQRRQPGPSIEPYVRPEFAREMRELRPAILAAAERHNRAELSGMTDREFAIVIAALLYNEHFGSLEERVVPLRQFAPFYEHLQVRANEAGANLTVWPANLRPSVAAEILRDQVPVPKPTRVLTRELTVAGSAIDLQDYSTPSDLYVAITEEIADPQLAVEYLAANLERGLYRAQFEEVQVTWRALAAWHNQGIVSPRDIRANPTASSYVRRTSAYLRAARLLIDTPPRCKGARCRSGDPNGRLLPHQHDQW